MRVSFDEVFEIMRNNISSTKDYVTIDARDAHGHISYEEIINPNNIPSFNKSPFDGYAIKVGYENYVVKGVIYAGDTNNYSINDNTCYKIMTGAMLPENTEMVIKKEDVEETSESIKPLIPLQKNLNIIFEGEDLKKGEIILKRGTYIDAYTQAVLISSGIKSIKVIKKPKILIFSTGTELLEPGDDLIKGKIFNSNTHFIKSKLQEWGLESTIANNIEDDYEKIKDFIKQSTEEFDLIISTGAMSVGDKDYIPMILDDIKAEIYFLRSKVKPGGNFALSKYNDSYLFTLSGNPFSSMAMIETVLKTFFYQLTDSSHFRLKKVLAEINEPIENNLEQHRIYRGVYKEGIFYKSKNQNSGSLSEFLVANAMIILPPKSVIKDKSEIILIK